MNTRTLGLALTMVATIAAGCGKEGPNVRPLTTSETALVAASNEFGFGLLDEVVSVPESNDKNVFISPLSVSMALGMTYNGARGDTEQAMRTTLAYGDLTTAQINEAYRGLIDLLSKMDPDVTLEIANSIWYREGFEVLPEFVATNQQSFGADVRSLDFTAPGSAETINTWVKQKTKDRIDSIVEGPIPAHIVMYLIDAIYFKGSWTEELDPGDTRDANFTTGDGSTKTVAMMTKPGSVAHARMDGYRAVELPYGFELFTMAILLPDVGSDVDDVITKLNREEWTAIGAAMNESEMSVYLPKFELEYKTSLKDVLAALGMAQAFSAEADLTGINADGGLFISDVKHKTFLKIDEEGTEAAAVTSVEVGRVSIPEEFRVDRPFVVVLFDKHSDVILFAGKVEDPGA